MKNYEANIKTLKGYCSEPQRITIAENLHHEEKEFFAAKLQELADIIRTMPKSYETDGQGGAAIIHLHYFFRGCDWYIIEKDSETEQRQAFGLACMQFDELGYIDLTTLIQHGVELDLHWTPKPLSEVKAKRSRSHV